MSPAPSLGGNAISSAGDLAFMNGHPDPEWRSYVDDDDDDDYVAPDPFALPLPKPAEQDDR
jgi:hypothetical protein